MTAVDKNQLRWGLTSQLLLEDAVIRECALKFDFLELAGAPPVTNNIYERGNWRRDPAPAGFIAEALEREELSLKRDFLASVEDWLRKIIANRSQGLVLNVDWEAALKYPEYVAKLKKFFNFIAGILYDSPARLLLVMRFPAADGENLERYFPIYEQLRVPGSALAFELHVHECVKYHLAVDSWCSNWAFETALIRFFYEPEVGNRPTPALITPVVNRFKSLALKPDLALAPLCSSSEKLMAEIDYAANIIEQITKESN